mgnify:CR=1 FL=1
MSRGGLSRTKAVAPPFRYRLCRAGRIDRRWLMPDHLNPKRKFRETSPCLYGTRA